MPFPQHARNYMAQEPKLPAPVYPPQEVARAILYAATHAKRDIYIGGGAKAVSVMSRVAPGTMSKVSSRLMPSHQQHDKAPRDPQGTLFQAGVDGRVRGDHPGHVMRTSLYTRSSLHPVVSGVIFAAAGLAAVALARRNSESRFAPPARRRWAECSPELEPMPTRVAAGAELESAQATGAVE